MLFLLGFLALLCSSLLSWSVSNNQAGSAIYGAPSRIKSISFSEIVEIADAVKAKNISGWCFAAISAISVYFLFLWSFQAWLLEATR